MRTKLLPSLLVASTMTLLGCNPEIKKSRDEIKREKAAHTRNAIQRIDHILDKLEDSSAQNQGDCFANSTDVSCEKRDPTDGLIDGYGITWSETCNPPEFPDDFDDCTRFYQIEDGEIANEVLLVNTKTHCNDPYWGALTLAECGEINNRVAHIFDEVRDPN